MRHNYRWSVRFFNL